MSVYHSPLPFAHVLTTDVFGRWLWGGSGWKPESERVLGCLFKGLAHLLIGNEDHRAPSVSFPNNLVGKVVLVRTDNSTTCHYINKLGGTKSVELCQQVWDLLHWCMVKVFQIRAIFVPADLICITHTLSFLSGVPLQDQREWALNQQVVN